MYYDPGIGTIGLGDDWQQITDQTRAIFSLATGYGLDDNILDAYQFLSTHYEPGDNIYLFGFSRGAYTIRALAGLLHLIGLLHPDQMNISAYAIAAYKKASEEGALQIGWQFKRVSGGRHVTIKFMGVWDTVASVLVPRKDRFYIPTLLKLPYTRTNPSVEVFRHAIAIDERRRMFRLNRWADPQPYKSNPFVSAERAKRQDIKQVWFAGVHSDVGGGYPEEESGLSKFPLEWMIREARQHGLQVRDGMFNHLVQGRLQTNSPHTYVPPDARAKIHESLTLGWKPLEWFPKRAKWKEWPQRQVVAGLYIPNAEPRFIPEGSLVHHSVVDRKNAGISYAPPNFPPSFIVEQ